MSERVKLCGCGDCKHSFEVWVYGELAGENGERGLECRYNAPITGGNGRAAWPIVDADDRCSQFGIKDIWEENAG